MFFDDDDFFREMEREMRKMIKIVERMMKDMERAPAGKPVVHGIRITIGPDGIPRVEEFGNVRIEGGEPKIVEYREPLVDVMRRDDTIIVTAELPGVEKENVHVRVKGNTLRIDAEGEFKYRKTVRLPAPVDPQSAKATFKNGILEVQLKAVQGRGEQGVEIKID